ncbi:MAG: hypothetical protein MUF01_06240 [Bryobacterales bacterium]|jgi:hypothetical protein|nr:hypothetical protein [Bryobacterales bacterium]
MTDISRRDLLVGTALWANPALWALAEGAASADPTFPGGSIRPGDVARTAMLHDAVILTMLSQGTPASIRHLLALEPADVLLGQALASGVPAGTEKPQPDALRLGAKMAAAADALLQPMLPTNTTERDACLLYWDVATMLGSSGSPGPLKEAIPMDQLRGFFEALHRRLFIGIHTLEPDAEDIEGWIERIVAWDAQREGMSDRYARALATRDSAEWRRFVEEAGFYSVEDPYIRLALAARKGAVTSTEASARLTASQPACVYAKAMQAAIRAAS